MVRDFQAVIGVEAKQQMQEMLGRQPDAVIACVGGGSNAMGIFYPYIDEKNVRLIGVEARSEEHTSELQSLMRISYAVFCLKKKTNRSTHLQLNDRHTTR